MEKTQTAFFQPVGHWPTGRTKCASADYEVQSEAVYAASCGGLCRRFQKKQMLLLKRFDYRHTFSARAGPAGRNRSPAASQAAAFRSRPSSRRRPPPPGWAVGRPIQLLLCYIMPCRSVRYLSRVSVSPRTRGMPGMMLVLPSPSTVLPSSLLIRASTVE